MIIGCRCNHALIGFGLLILARGCAETEHSTALSRSHLYADGKLKTTSRELAPFLDTLRDKTKIIHAWIDGGDSVGKIDLTPIADCPNLRSLTVAGAEIATLEPIGRLQRLEKLHLQDCRMSDWQSLSHLTNLRILDLDFCNLVDLNPLSRLTRLEELGLGFSSKTAIDITPILGLPSIKVLSVQKGMLDDEQKKRIRKRMTIRYVGDS